jgi:hypothetical protein
VTLVGLVKEEEEEECPFICFEMGPEKAAMGVITTRLEKPWASFVTDGSGLRASSAAESSIL